MTPSIIRAARGFLNWQQHDLAAAARLSLSVVNKYERGMGKTRQTTVRAMTSALEEAGIEFLPNGAIRWAEETNDVRHFAGADYMKKLNEDIYAAVRNSDREIYTCSPDEKLWFDPEIKKLSEEFYNWRRKIAVKELYLVSEHNKLFVGTKQNYRLLPANMLGKITYTMYADRMALILWRRKKTFVLRGKYLVEPFREQFKFLWRMGQKP